MRNESIIEAYNRGARAEDLAKQHGISTRQVNRIVASPLPKNRGKSKDNTLRELRAIIIALMKSEGRDFNRCELCDRHITKFDIHHTKYEGATYYDLKIVCRRCNTAPLNRYLS